MNYSSRYLPTPGAFKKFACVWRASLTGPSALGTRVTSWRHLRPGGRLGRAGAPRLTEAATGVGYRAGRTPGGRLFAPVIAGWLRRGHRAPPLVMSLPPWSCYHVLDSLAVYGQTE